jgi:phosphatidate cytidylyltransferase
MGGAADLPHWSDPPTGEVPRILVGDDEGDEPREDDMAAWQALGARGSRWRGGDAGDDWDDVDEIGMLAGDDEPVGALDQSRTEHSDLYSFDEDFERVEAERSGSVPVVTDYDEYEPEPAETRAAAAAATTSARARHARTNPPRPTGRSGQRGPTATGGGNDDLPSRVVVGIGLIVLLIIAYAIGSRALVALAALILVASAAEAYGMLQRSGFRPATLLGLVGTGGIVLGAYWKGLEALPLVIVLVFAGSMMWYLLRIVEARPLANVAVTTMAFLWIGVLGSYAALMLRAPHGKGLLLGAVIVAVAADVVAFLVGRWIGSRPMAASISPSKTIEGFVGGLVAAIVAGAIVGKELTPWGGMKHGLFLGLVVGLVAAAGDLFESMIKRDLGMKDSGTVLPGHGGLLDRFDSIIVALPAAYYVAWLCNIKLG